MGNSSSSSSRSSYPGNRGSASASRNNRHTASATAPTASRTHTVVRGSNVRAGSSSTSSGGNRVVTTTYTTVPPSGGGGGSSQQQPPLTAQTISRPGAYSISRNDAGPTQVFRVTVPAGVGPNQEFQVHAGSRVVRVRCPPDVRPGQSLQITVPPEPVVRQNQLGMAPLTSVTGEGGGAVRMSSQATLTNQPVIEAEEARRRQEEENRIRQQQQGRRSPQPEDDDINARNGSGGTSTISPLIHQVHPRLPRLRSSSRPTWWWFHRELSPDRTSACWLRVGS